MHFFGMEASSVQLRVGAPVLWRSGRTQVPPQSSQHSGRFHTPAVPKAALGTATIYASLQQPVDYFCKEIMPGQHRREAPICIFRASGQAGIADPADRESASLGGASPLSPTIFFGAEATEDRHRTFNPVR